MLLIVHALGEAGNWQKAKDSGTVALPYTHRITDFQNGRQVSCQILRTFKRNTHGRIAYQKAAPRVCYPGNAHGRHAERGHQAG